MNQAAAALESSPVHIITCNRAARVRLRQRIDPCSTYSADDFSRSSRALSGFLLVVVIGIVSGRSIHAARTDPVELQAVYAMMAATGNDWAASIPDVCERTGRWHGIECARNGEVFHVVGMSFGLVTDHEATAFPACAPNSTVAAAVANLTHLRKLSYFACCTANPQPIPREIGQLGATLETLHLRSNGHMSILPPELANLTRLRTLDVHGNSLSGGLPVWLSSLAALQVVDVSGNAFHGEVDARAFHNLDRLIIFDASANHLSGVLPESIGTRLTALEKLDLSDNNFTGAIPATLGDLGNLLSLNLAFNGFTGPLPDTLGRLADLKSMDLQGNRFRCAIPASFGTLESLEGLVLSGAELRGPIPSSLGSLSNLRALFLDGNRLSGPIPPALGGLPRVYELELSRNLLVGRVPFSPGFISRLGRRLGLQSNDGLCYELQAANSITNPAAQESTIWPASAPSLQLAICSSPNRPHNAIANSSDPPVRNPLPSSSCSQAFRAGKRSWIMTILLVTCMSRWVML